MFITKYMGKGTASENEVNTMCNIIAIFLLIITLGGIRDILTKMTVKDNTIILIKPPFTKKYRKMSDIEKIYSFPDHIEIYMKDYTFSSKFATFPKEKAENVDIFLKQAEENGVLIKSSGFDDFNMLK